MEAKDNYEGSLSGKRIRAKGYTNKVTVYQKWDLAIATVNLEEVEAKNKPESVMESPMVPAIKALTTGTSMETTWSHSEPSDDITETFSKDPIKREFCRISTIATSNARTIPSQKADQLGYTKDGPNPTLQLESTIENRLDRLWQEKKYADIRTLGTGEQTQLKKNLTKKGISGEEFSETI